MKQTTSNIATSLNSCVPQMRALVLALSVAWLCAVSIELGKAMDKKARISWSVSKLTEADLMDGSATVQFKSNQDVAEVFIDPTASLTRFLTVEPAGYTDVMKDVWYDVTVSIIPEGGLPHTTGGTIKVRERDGSRTLAKPLTVSLKVAGGNDEGGGEEGEGAGDGEEGEEGESNTLSWTPELIDNSLFENGEKGENGEEGDKAVISFTSSLEIEKVCIWITPSAQDFITAEPDMFSPVLNDGTEYEINLTLFPPLAELMRNVGGTLHVRACDESGKMRRTYDPPIGIELIVDPEEAPVEADPEVVVSSADYSEGPVAPSQIVAIFGEGLGPNDLEVFNTKGTSAEDYLDDPIVLFDGIAAPVLAAQSNQVNTIIPIDAAGKSNIEMRVIHGGKISAAILLPVATAAPALFTLDGSGEGPGAILNGDLSLNSRANPAARVSVVVLFGTGGGLTDPPGEDGTIVAESAPLEAPVSVEINGVAAQVQWAGSPEGLIQGAVQVNVEIPIDPRVVPGVWPVVLIVDGVRSSGNATIALE